MLATAATGSELAPEETPGAPAISLLLVDDNPTFLGIAKRFLQEQFAGEVEVVAVAGTGEQGLLLAEQFGPRVALVDLAMPGLNGFETTRRLKALQPGVHVIVLTLLDEADYRAAALAAGASEFVCKNALYTDLLPAIRRVVQPAPAPAAG